MRRFSVRPAAKLKDRTFFNVETAAHSLVWHGSEADVLPGVGDWASA